MEGENDDHKIRILQAKMDAIKKTSKKKPDPPEQMPDLEPEPLVPEPERQFNSEQMIELPSVPEAEPEPEENVKPVKQKAKRVRRSLWLL